MHRRTFLLSGAAAVVPWRRALAAGDWLTYEMTARVQILKPRGVSRVWLPLPLVENTAWQRNHGSAWSSNAARAHVVSDGKYGATMLYAEWSSGSPVLEVTSRFATRDRAVNFAHGRVDAERLTPAEREFFTAPTDFIPTDGIVRDTARDIVKRARGDLDRGRAIYEWVVENTFRDPQVRGCGWGDIKSMLETRNFGGKCGDLNAMFVGLARSVGIAARDVYGLRVAPSQQGFASLGVESPDVTRAQHCRAEFFAHGVGWVPVDPADVRKVALEEPPGQLPLSHPKVLAARKSLFGGWEMNWVAYNMAHDVRLPHSSGPKLPYLMYPNGETGGARLDPLDPEAFSYSITARRISA